MLDLYEAEQSPTVPFNSISNVDLFWVKGGVHEFSDPVGLSRDRWGGGEDRQGFSGDSITRSRPGLSVLPALGDDGDDGDCIYTQTGVTRPPNMHPRGVTHL